MNKVIFLDIDGVLNTKWWYTQMNRNTPKDKYGYAFDPKAVANLRRIVEETGADIVISSSWKCMGFFVLSAFGNFLVYQDFFQKYRGISLFFVYLCTG